MGGAIFISVGQNILTSNLISGITQIVEGIDPAMIVNTGATELRHLVPADQLPAVLGVYNHALRQVFLIIQSGNTGRTARNGVLLHQPCEI